MSTRKYNYVTKETDSIPAGCLLTDHELKLIRERKANWRYCHQVPETKVVRVKSEDVYWSFGFRFTTTTI